MSNLYMPDPEQYLDSLEHPESLEKPPRKWQKIVFAVVFTSIIGFIGYGAYIISIAAQASSQPYSLTGLQTDGHGRTNVLILGIGNPGHAGEKLSDTLLVISLDAKTHHAVYLSIPRDLRVHPAGYSPMKINQANALGGAPLARQTVEEVLGIPIQYTVTTDFNGLKQLVDAVGGIDVVVKTALNDPEYPCSDDENRACGLSIAAGPQHMNGSIALQYARCRKGNCGNDFGRAARQQEVIDLVARKIEQPSMIVHPVKIAHIAEAVRANMMTDMSGLNLVDILNDLRQSRTHTDRFVLSTDTGGLLTGAYGSSDLLPVGGDYSHIQDKVQQLINK